MYIYKYVNITRDYIYIARVFREEFCFSLSIFFYHIKRDEVRRSINKTNIHAFLKHYFYKYWLTPWQTPCERARAKKYAFGTARSTASISSRRRKLFAFHPLYRISREDDVKSWTHRKRTHINASTHSTVVISERIFLFFGQTRVQ